MKTGVPQSGHVCVLNSSLPCKSSSSLLSDLLWFSSFLLCLQWNTLSPYSCFWCLRLSPNQLSLRWCLLFPHAWYVLSMSDSSSRVLSPLLYGGAVLPFLSCSCVGCVWKPPFSARPMPFIFIYFLPLFTSGTKFCYVLPIIITRPLCAVCCGLGPRIGAFSNGLCYPRDSIPVQLQNYDY